MVLKRAKSLFSKKNSSSQPKNMLKDTKEKPDKANNESPKVPPIDMKKILDHSKEDLIDLERMQNEK